MGEATVAMTQAALAALEAGPVSGPVTPLDRLKQAVAAKPRGHRGWRTTHEGKFQDAHPVAAVLAADVVAVADGLAQTSQAVAELAYGCRRARQGPDPVFVVADHVHELIEHAETAALQAAGTVFRPQVEELPQRA